MSKNIIKNTSMLYLMNAAKMLFPLITLPYLTRVLTINCYGEVSYVKAVMQYMQLIIDFGFILSGTKDIINARNNKDRLNQEVGDILLAKIILGVIAFIFLCGMLVCIPILRKNILFTILSFIVVFMTCLLLDYLFRGLEQMHVITIRFVLMKSISTILTFLLVKDDNDILWIPVLDILGTLFAIVLVWNEVFKLNIKIKFSKLSIITGKIKESAVYFLSNMASTAFSALNTLLIGLYIQSTEVAFWSLCLQLVTAVQSLYTPITDGMYPYMVKHKDISIINTTLRVFMPLVTVGCVVTFIIAKNVLNIIGGSEYITAAPVLRCLIPVLFFSFPAMLFGWPTLGAIGKERETTKTTVFTAYIQILGLILLLITDKFTLINIALLRGFTEAILFATRFQYFYKFKWEFK